MQEKRQLKGLRLKFTNQQSERSFLNAIYLSDYSEKQTLPIYPIESEIIDSFNQLLYDVFQERIDWYL